MKNNNPSGLLVTALFAGAAPASRKPARKFTLADADRIHAADVKRLRKRNRNIALQKRGKP